MQLSWARGAHSMASDDVYDNSVKVFDKILNSDTMYKIDQYSRFFQVRIYKLSQAKILQVHPNSNLH